MLAAGALGYGGSVMVQNIGISRTSVTHAALLIGAVPVLVAIIAAVWYRAVARPVAWFGFAVSLGGVGLVTAGGGGGGATMAGDGLVLVSLLLSATVTVAQGRLLAGRDPIAVTAVQFLGAALGSLPVALVSEGVPAAPAGVGVVLAVVALALAGTLLPFTLFAFGQTRVPAEVAGAFLNLEPLVGAIAGVVAFGDPVGLAQVAGGLAILAGIVLSSLPLIAAGRVARRAALVAGAGTGADARTGRVPAAGSAGRVGAGIGAGRAGAELARRTEPPSPEPTAVEARVNECGALPEDSVERDAHCSERQAGEMGICGGSRGRGIGEDATRRAGAAQRAGGGTATRPRAGSGARVRRTPGSRDGSGRRPGEPGRKPGRGRATAGGGLGGSGRRATGGRGRSWPGASTGRSAAGR